MNSQVILTHKTFNHWSSHSLSSFYPLSTSLPPVFIRHHCSPLFHTYVPWPHCLMPGIPQTWLLLFYNHAFSPTLPPFQLCISCLVNMEVHYHSFNTKLKYYLLGKDFFFFWHFLTTLHTLHCLRMQPTSLLYNLSHLSAVIIIYLGVPEHQLRPRF